MSTATIDLSARAFWQQHPSTRDAAFAALRRESPISWQRPPERVDPEAARLWDSGYWAVVGNADVRAVSRDATSFSSTHGVMFEGEILKNSHVLLEMDPPEHTTTRALISDLFNPRYLASTEAEMERRARAIVAALPDRSEFDFIECVASRLPLITLLDLIGVPDEDRNHVSAMITALLAWTDRGLGDSYDGLLDAAETLEQYALGLARHRDRRRGEDIVSRLVHSGSFRRREISGFVVMLAVASDTVRRAAAAAAQALYDHPDQRAVLLSDLPGRIRTAVDEFLRWATPVTAFCRTAVSDVELSGQPIAAGERVALFYRSANFDESVFEAPQRFDVLRRPNRHVAFGGGGPHHCIGAALGRAQLRSIMAAFLTRAPAYELDQLQVSPGNGETPQVTRLPCRLGGG